MTRSVLELPPSQANFAGPWNRLVKEYFPHTGRVQCEEFDRKYFAVCVFVIRPMTNSRGTLCFMKSM